MNIHMLKYRDGQNAGGRHTLTRIYRLCRLQVLFIYVYFLTLPDLRVINMRLVYTILTQSQLVSILECLIEHYIVCIFGFCNYSSILTDRLLVLKTADVITTIKLCTLTALLVRNLRLRSTNAR